MHLNSNTHSKCCFDAKLHCHQIICRTSAVQGQFTLMVCQTQPATRTSATGTCFRSFLQCELLALLVPLHVQAEVWLPSKPHHLVDGIGPVHAMINKHKFDTDRTNNTLKFMSYIKLCVVAQIRPYLAWAWVRWKYSDPAHQIWMWTIFVLGVFILH